MDERVSIRLRPVDRESGQDAADPYLESMLVRRISDGDLAVTCWLGHRSSLLRESSAGRHPGSARWQQP
jgi:hypothetical protein